MTMRLALLALMSLPLAACDEAAMAEFRKGFGAQSEAAAEEPAKPRPPAVSPLVEPIETNAMAPAPVATAEASTYYAGAFTARGNEPFWSAEVGGNRAVYKTAGNPGGRSVTVNRLVFSQGVEYVGTLDGRVFTVNIRGTACTDTMSGQEFPMTATLTVRGQTLRGCAAPVEGATAAADS